MAPHLQGWPLRFHPLAFLEDGGEVVVGRSDIDSYGVFPADGAALVRELAGGRPPADAADWYADTFGERVDMQGFLATLHELRLVRSEDEPEVAVTAPVRGRRLGRVLFSGPAWGLYAAVLCAACMHASWNAVIKVKGDRLSAMLMMTVASSAIQRTPSPAAPTRCRALASAASDRSSTVKAWKSSWKPKCR